MLPISLVRSDTPLRLSSRRRKTESVRRGRSLDSVLPVPSLQGDSCLQWFSVKYKSGRHATIKRHPLWWGASQGNSPSPTQSQRVETQTTRPRNTTVGSFMHLCYTKCFGVWIMGTKWLSCVCRRTRRLLSSDCFFSTNLIWYFSLPATLFCLCRNLGFYFLIAIKRVTNISQSHSIHGLCLRNVALCMILPLNCRDQISKLYSVVRINQSAYV